VSDEKRDEARAERVAAIFAEQDAAAGSRTPAPAGWGSKEQRRLAAEAAEAFRACLNAEARKSVAKGADS
jgi:hypothetical protein